MEKRKRGGVLAAILKYCDDVFFLSGVAFIARAGFLWHETAGYAVIGAGLITYGVLIARAKGGGEA